MAVWSKDELCIIAESDDLHISPFREDGVTYGTSTWIWSAVVGDALYVRAYNGQNSPVVSSGTETKGRPDHCSGHDEGSYLRAGRWVSRQPPTAALKSGSA